MLHDFLVRCFTWRYECGRCGSEYSLPGSDFSFFYGYFLGVSKNAETAIFNATEDPIFDEIRSLVESRLRCVDPTELGEICRKIITAVSDCDSRGAPFVFDESPGCPSCGSAQVAFWTETDEPWLAEPTALTHRQWDTWTADQRADVVHQQLTAIARARHQ